MPFPSPFFQRSVLGSPRRLRPWRARAFHLNVPQPNLPPLIDNLPGQAPGALQKTCPPVSAFGRAFFTLAYLAWLNVPFTKHAHPFVARQCSSTALLRQ